MKSYCYSFISVVALMALGLSLTDCQPVPAAGSVAPSVTSALAPNDSAAKIVFAKYRFGFFRRVRQNREASVAAGRDRP